MVAHADDAEWGCSGTVAKWCAEGWEVVHVLCTDGSKGSDDPDMTSGRLAGIRREEQRNAGKVLGLHDVVFLGYEDSMLQPTLELRRDIAREIRRHKPDVLICMSPVRRLSGDDYLGHPDHYASGEAALSAVFPSARDRLTFPELLEEGLEPHKVREVYLWGSDQPDTFIDVTDTFDKKVEALFCHRSQMGDPTDGDRRARWRQRYEEAGRRIDAPLAESFKRVEIFR